jgi:hypothetical protein
VTIAFPAGMTRERPRRLDDLRKLIRSNRTGLLALANPVHRDRALLGGIAAHDHDDAGVRNCFIRAISTGAGTSYRNVCAPSTIRFAALT